MDDIFSQFGDIFGSAFGSSFGGFGGGGQRVSKGSNLRIRVKLSLEEIVNGVEKKIKVKRKILSPDSKFSTCTTCNGTGQVTRVTNTILGRMQSSSICPACGGSGQTIISRGPGTDSNGMLNSEETVSIKIPPGVEEGMQLKVSTKEMILIILMVSLEIYWFSLKSQTMTFLQEMENIFTMIFILVSQKPHLEYQRILI